MMPSTDIKMQIPVVDISGSALNKATADALVNAAATFGFVYIKSEGKDIPVEAIDSIFNLSKKFFSSSVGEKEPCKIDKTNRGWSGMHTETLDAKNQRVGDFKEALNFGEFLEGKAQQPLPASLKDHESELSTFQNHCSYLALKILTLFAVGLKIDNESGGAHWFSSRHQGGSSGSILRLLHYPAIKSSADFHPEVDIRAGAHSDYGSITLLFQRPGQPGLEIIPPSTNPTENTSYNTSAATWTPVPVYPPGTENDPSPPILVNIGDLLSYWTNGLLKSTVHRVVFPKGGPEGGEDRYSMAYFSHPVGSTPLIPIPSEMVSALKRPNGVGPEGKNSMTADEHLQSRLKASYLSLYKDGDGELSKA